MLHKHNVGAFWHHLSIIIKQRRFQVINLFLKPFQVQEGSPLKLCTRVAQIQRGFRKEHLPDVFVMDASLGCYISTFRRIMQNRVHNWNIQHKKMLDDLIWLHLSILIKQRRFQVINLFPSAPVCLSVCLGVRFCFFVILFTLFCQTLYLQIHLSFLSKLFRVQESAPLRLCTRRALGRKASSLGVCDGCLRGLLQ